MPNPGTSGTNSPPSHGLIPASSGYGNTLAWSQGLQPNMGEVLVEVQDDLDKQKFYKEYAELLSRPTPMAKKGTAK